MWMLCVAVVLAGLCLAAAAVTTLDGKRYDGEASLEPGNIGRLKRIDPAGSGEKRDVRLGPDDDGQLRANR
jgi:hypothetical protein